MHLETECTENKNMFLFVFKNTKFSRKNKAVGNKNKSKFIWIEFLNATLNVSIPIDYSLSKYVWFKFLQIARTPLWLKTYILIEFRSKHFKFLTIMNN